ncbi:MAG: T9SS type A sorting domain-containing protein, partial [Cytophagaceae bacterium]
NGPTNGTAYTVVYGPRGFTPTAASLSTPGTASPITLSNLTPNTPYDVYVVATCGTIGGSVRTGPIPFSTNCATVTTFPYTENFDGVTAPNLPCGVTVFDANNDNNTWVNAAATPSSSPNAMRYSYSFTAPADDWFFTNAISMQAGATYQLQFKYSAYSATYPEGLEVKVGTAATVVGQTTTVFTNTNIANTSYVTTTPGTTTANGQVVGFTPTTSGIYYFGFHAISAVNQYYLYVDDVNVNVTSLAGCPTPTALSVNSITDSRATVVFSGPSVATSYKVSYVPAGTPLTASSPFVTTTTTSALIATGLLPDTPYEVYVQGTCGAAGLGITAGPVGFRTACATTTVFPYAQNFDGVTAPALPCGITVLDANSDGSGWATNNYTPSSSPNAMRYDYSTINGADDWFFTNALSLQAGMSYQLQFKSRVFSPNYPERLEVKAGLGTTAATQTTTLFYNAAMTNTAYITTSSGTGTGQVAPFVPTTSGIYFIGFHAFSRPNQFNIYVDDIRVTASVITATKNNAAPGFRAEASPVPFGESLTLTLNTLQAGPLQLTLHDAVGRVVRETTTSVPAGASSLAVPAVRTLPAGIYLLTVRQGGNTQVIRVAHE